MASEVHYAGFASNHVEGYVMQPGYFLASHENCVRVSATMTPDYAPGLEKIICQGTLYNYAGVVGIVYENVDVSKGAMPGSVVTSGLVYRDRVFNPIGGELTEDDITMLEDAGIVFVDEKPSIERLY